MLTVMIVDDDDISLGYLRRLLREYFRIRTAECATEAIGGLERQPIDVLVTDLNLGTDSGLALLSQARIRFPKTRRMLTSGHELGDIELLHGAGLFERFFSKPLQALDLIEAICEPTALTCVRSRWVRPPGRAQLG